MFRFYEGEEEREENLIGIVVSHVDDLLHAGNEDFEEKMIALKQMFKFGSEEELEFRYVGMHIKQNKEGIMVDQDHYLEGLEIPKVDYKEKDEETLSDEDQTKFRGLVGKLNHVSAHGRPDLCFETKSLSTKLGKATQKDLKDAIKKLHKAHDQTTTMVFPDLGNSSDWVIIGHGDAGIRSLPDKTSSVGGTVVILANRKTRKCCVLSWRSKKLVRKVISAMAGEAIAMNDTIGETIYSKSILKQIFGEKIEEIPVIIVTDSNNLEKAIYSTSLVEDGRLIPDIAVIKEAVDRGVVTEVRKVKSEEMLANCLTKAGASSQGLARVLQTGSYSIPGGFEINRREVI